MSSTSSIVQVLDSIVDKKIATEYEKTTPIVVLYKSGSTLIPTNVGQVSY